MLGYVIDDLTDTPLSTAVEVTIEFPIGKRWVFFATPELFSSVGDYVDGTSVRLHLGERHMIVVSEISPAVIDAVLKELDRSGELERRAAPLKFEG